MHFRARLHAKLMRVKPLELTHHPAATTHASPVCTSQTALTQQTTYNLQQTTQTKQQESHAPARPAPGRAPRTRTARAQQVRPPAGAQCPGARRPRPPAAHLPPAPAPASSCAHITTHHIGTSQTLAAWAALSRVLLRMDRSSAAHSCAMRDTTEAVSGPTAHADGA